MHNLHNITTGALFAHMLLLNCNLHFLHIAFYTALKVVCANSAPTTFNTQKIRVVLFGHSPNRIPTKLFPFTILTVLAYPDGIKLVHGLLNQLRIVGEDAGLEVARSIAFHANACAGEVGAADIGHLAIEDQNLEMYSRTKHPLQAIKQGWVFVEVLTERGTRLLGMDEPHLNALFDEFCQNRKKGLRLRAYLDIQVFDVGGANPEAALDLGNPSEYFGVMGRIGDEFQHGCCLFNNAKIA